VPLLSDEQPAPAKAPRLKKLVAVAG